MQINSAHWRQQLLKPDWYIRLYPDFLRIEQETTGEEKRQLRRRLKEEMYQLLEDALSCSKSPFSQKRW